VGNEVAGGWSSLHNEELLNFYSLAGIIRMLKSGKMGRASSMNGIEEECV
jgi:hypothetical protein